MLRRVILFSFRNKEEEGSWETRREWEKISKESQMCCKSEIRNQKQVSLTFIICFGRGKEISALNVTSARCLCAKTMKESGTKKQFRGMRIWIINSKRFRKRKGFWFHTKPLPRFVAFCFSVLHYSLVLGLGQGSIMSDEPTELFPESFFVCFEFPFLFSLRLSFSSSGAFFSLDLFLPSFDPFFSCKCAFCLWFALSSWLLWLLVLKHWRKIS